MADALIGVVNPSARLASNILIYRNELLPVSETFIQAQAESLTSFRPRFLGMRRSSRSLSLPADSIAVSDGSPLSKLRGLDNIIGFGRPFFRAKLDKQLRAGSPSLLHAHFALDASVVTALADRLGVPLVVTLHGYDVTMRDSMFRRSVAGLLYLMRRKQLWRRASVFICVSEFIRRKAIEVGFPEDKLRVHYIGIDRRLFQASTDSARTNTILFVGRLVEKKGCEYLIRAAAQLKRRHPDVELVIIGDGPRRADLERQCGQLGVNCRFEGSQPRETIIRRLNVVKVLCVPSVTAASGDAEGLGMVFAEAQACGTPVVSFNHGGIPEVVLDRQTGLLAPERDSAALADHLNRMLSDQLFWEHCSKRGIDWVAQRFDLAKQTRKLEKLYGQILQSGKTLSSVKPIARQSVGIGFAHEQRLDPQPET